MKSHKGLYPLHLLIGAAINAADGDIGKVKDVYFDDGHWTARYLVVDAGSWLEDRKVLVSPYAVVALDVEQPAIRVNLTRQQVKGSPPIDADKPVSRQHELEFLAYYGYPDYWGGALLWGATAYPFIPAATARPADDALAEALEREARSGDPHLHSAREVVGYHLRAADGEIGHVAGFLIEDQSWAIRYLQVDTRNWLPGKHVLIPTPWVRQIDWAERIAAADLMRAAVENAPPYDLASPLSRADEARLYRHYRRAGYWEERPEG